MSGSEYFSRLSGDVKDRYIEKLKIIDGVDPYCLGLNDLSSDLHTVPSVGVIDLVSYFVLTHSFYTGDQLKAYKSLQAYKYYEAGFVLEVLMRQHNENVFIIVGKVKHSQKLNAKPLQAWILILKDGGIASAHCTCMAGLGEVCSHVAAILFYISNSYAAAKEEACTQKLSVWQVPHTKNVDMIRVCEVDWPGKVKKTKVTRKPLPPISDSELVDMLGKFKQIGLSPALSRVVEPFASEMDVAISDNLPISLSDYFDPSLVGEDFNKIVQIAHNKINITVTQEQSNIIAEKTKGQHQNNMWFKFRSGRITASKFKGVCRTNINCPSMSLLKCICYPQKTAFTTKQTSYGLKNEKVALDEYLVQMRELHQGFRERKVGFCISTKQPEFGASPDMIVECDCCGLASVEVKCPFNMQNLTLEKFAALKSSCLVKVGDNYFLDKNHAYYYQCQLQMFVLNAKLCDFVLWSESILSIQRIAYDPKFCTENIEKALNFFNHVIKPELISRCFTNQPGIVPVQDWCICGKPDDGRPMLKCDNDNCEISWYHFQCIGLNDIPKSWFCQYCSE